nr:hypothetical protein M01B2.5 - Caenorhabditis elegans [Caenorhabditis elegans]
MPENILSLIDNLLTPIFLYLNNLNFTVSVVGVIANLFHLSVLFRKPMRILTINIFMIGIALCDLCKMISVIFTAIINYYQSVIQSQMPTECFQRSISNIYRTYNNQFMLKGIRFSKKLSVWLAVSLAILRAVVIKYPINTKIQDFTSSAHGIRIFLLICLMNSPLWYLQNRFSIDEQEKWTTPIECLNFTENSTQIIYLENSSGLDYSTSLLIDGIIPSILLPLSTIVLLYELKKIKKLTASTNSRSTDNNTRTTKLVCFVTITFLISTVPLGILYLIEMIFFDTDGLDIIRKISSIFKLISLINGTIHFLICFFMSTLYRKTVKEMFGMQPHNGNLINVQPTFRKSEI